MLICQTVDLAITAPLMHTCEGLCTYMYIYVGWDQQTISYIVLSNTLNFPLREISHWSEAQLLG